MRDPRLDPGFVQAWLHLGKHHIHSDDMLKFIPQGVKTRTGTRTHFLSRSNDNIRVDPEILTLNLTS